MLTGGPCYLLGVGTAETICATFGELAARRKEIAREIWKARDEKEAE